MVDLFGLFLNYTVFFERIHYLLVIILIIVILLSDRSPNSMLDIYNLYFSYWRNNFIFSFWNKLEKK